MQCVDDQRDAQFLYIIFIPPVFLALHVSKDLLVHHQESIDSPDSTIVPIVLCDTVYQAMLLIMNE